jgi:hypothetical protein
MKSLCFVFSLLSIVLTGCSSVSVTRDYDASADFAGLKSYAWQHETQPKTGNPRIDNDLIDERVRSAVDLQLAQKGFILSDEGDTDFLVTYYVQYKQRISGNSVSFGVGASRNSRYGSIGYDTSISDYDEGWLTIDMIDPESGKMFWRGVGIRATYESQKPKKVSKIINHAVSRILKDFPPGS